MLVRTAEESSHVSVAGVGVDDSHSHCSWQTWPSIQIPPWRSSQQMPLCISTCPRKWASCGQDQSLRSFEQSNTENACGINERKFPNVPMPVMSCGESISSTCPIFLLPHPPFSWLTSYTQRTWQKNVMNLETERNMKLSPLHLVFYHKHGCIFLRGTKLNISSRNVMWLGNLHEMLAACSSLLNQCTHLKPGYLCGYNIMVPSFSCLIFQNQSEFCVWALLR